MRNLRTRTMSGIFIITLVLGVLLNIIFKQAVQDNFYKFIEKDFQNIKLILRDQINNEIVLNSVEIKEGGMETKGDILVDNLSRRLDCFVALCSETGVLINDSKDMLVEIKNNWFQDAFKDKVTVHIEDEDKGVVGILKYPYYYNGKYLGTLVLEKDFSEMYSSNKMLEKVFTAIELGLLIMFLGVVNIFLKKIIRPLNILAAEIKRVENGDYRAVDIKCGKDELGIVIKNFNSMTKEIKDKLDTINEEKQKIEILAKTQKQFFDNVTHELKTPLTAISGYAQLLETKFENEEFRKRAITRISLESDRLHKLVYEVITISKKRNSLNRKNDVLNVTNIINEVIADIEVIYKDIIIDIEDNGLGCIHMEGIYDEVYQIFLNLLDNSAKYSLDNKVSVFVKEKNNKVNVTIKNKCDYIPEDIVKDLLEPFTKYDFNKNIESTGLGLYITSELVESNKGSIDYNFKNDDIEFNIGFSICE